MFGSPSVRKLIIPQKNTAPNILSTAYLRGLLTISAINPMSMQAKLAAIPALRRNLNRYFPAAWALTTIAASTKVKMNNNELR
jgi:hypothetical protein